MLHPLSLLLLVTAGKYLKTMHTETLNFSNNLQSVCQNSTINLPKIGKISQISGFRSGEVSN
jgi:hypothetical protein